MSKQFWIILAAGCVACLIFGGFGHLIYWVLICFSVELLTRKPLLGGLAILAIAAIAVVPYLLDDTVYDKQLAAKRSVEIRTEPLDLRGKTVLFSDEAFSTNAGCRALCWRIAKYSGADQVLFGVDRSVVGYGDGPRNFLDLELYAYPNEADGTPSATSQPVRVFPDRIDYVVFRFAHDSALEQKWLKEIGTYGMEKPSLVTDVVVVETTDGATAHAFGDNVRLRLLKMNRRGTGLPYMPFVGGGKHKFSQQYVNNNMRGAEKNEVEALEFMCGPDTREGVQTCRRSLFR